jgi:SAM-dependent methyltransferase
MDPQIYHEMAKIEGSHWWFEGRRQILKSLINRGAGQNSSARVLDEGCGTGGNGSMLSVFGKVFGLEYEASAAKYCKQREIAHVIRGDISQTIPFRDASFDLILLSDVLEHLKEDLDCLGRLTALLRPGGVLVVTVPAFSFLWSYHDVIHHHERRYRLPEVVALLTQSDLKILYASYFNFWLFPLIAAVRFLKKIAGHEGNAGDLVMPHPWTNSLLTKIFGSESRFMSRLRLPFGVSIVTLAMKAAENR